MNFNKWPLQPILPPPPHPHPPYCMLTSHAARRRRLWVAGGIHVPGIAYAMTRIPTCILPRTRWRTHAQLETPLNQYFPNSPLPSFPPPKPYLVLRDTLCSCEAYGMRPMHKKRKRKKNPPHTFPHAARTQADLAHPQGGCPGAHFVGIA
jgi:hypothetical protein